MGNTLRLFGALALVLTLTPLASAQNARRSDNPQSDRGTSAYADRVEVLNARGGATVYTDRTAFNQECPNTLPTETFEEANIPPGGFDVTEAPLDENSDDLVFDPGDILPGLAVTINPLADPPTADLFVSGAGFGGAPSIQVGNNPSASDLVLEFDPTVDCAGFDIDLNNAGASTTVTAFDGSGNSLGSTSVSGFALQFVGFSSFATPIASVVIGTSVSLEFADVDNVTFGDVAATGVTIEATASTLTVQQGGSVTFNYTITNNTNAAVTGDLFFRAVLGANTVAQGEIINNGTLPAGESFSGSFTQNVPPNAPTASYSYSLNIGIFPNTVVDSETFVITVTPAAAAAPPSAVADWTVSGVTPWASSVASVSEASVVASPNPFAGQTALRFSLDEASEVRLAVYDLLGREVALLVDGSVEAGQHEATFEARDLAAGTYVYRLVVNEQVQTGRLTLAH